MNSKIVNKLQQLIKHSPHILMDGQSLQTLISGTFDVNLDPIKITVAYLLLQMKLTNR